MPMPRCSGHGWRGWGFDDPNDSFEIRHRSKEYLDSICLCSGSCCIQRRRYSGSKRRQNLYRWLQAIGVERHKVFDAQGEANSFYTLWEMHIEDALDGTKKVEELYSEETIRRFSGKRWW